MADPGCPGAGGAPKEALCPELEWEGAGECPRVWLFGSRSPPNRIGINPPCLPLARAKPRVPLGVFQDARRGGLQLRSDDRWRAGRGGAGRGGRWQVRGARGGGGGTRHRCAGRPAELSMDCSPLVAGAPQRSPENSNRIFRAPPTPGSATRQPGSPIPVRPELPVGRRKGQRLVCAGVHVHAWTHTHTHTHTCSRGALGQ